MQQLLQITQKLDDFVLKNDLVERTSMLKQEFSIQSVSQLKETIQKQQEENRVLKIGIIGRVKAGKSSFLNALVFDGQDILPKAATPMTAALTILEYSQDFGAEVDFYSSEDIENIKQEHYAYQKRMQEIENKRFAELCDKQASKGLFAKDSQLDAGQERDLREKARAYAEREMKNDKRLSSSYDQYERIRTSGLDNTSNLEQYKSIRASNMNELKEKLMDFVGSSGKFMPLTKSVTLKLNYESLKDLQIIDSPGINDPVASREQRTSELLKDCDVVFLVSPSGQFLNAEDMDLLDRVNTKEGIQEFYVVASQSDNQLFGSIREKANKIFDRALECVQEDLTKHMQATFAQKKLEYQQNGYEKFALMFDKLMKHPVVYTSGMAYYLMKNLDNSTSWDEGAKKVWENLQSDYRDFFDETSLSQSNLKKLANLEAISCIIKEVRERKEEIQKNRQEEYISTKIKSLREYQKTLMAILVEDKQRLEESDIKKIQKEKEELLNIKDKGIYILDAEYEDGVEKLNQRLDETLIGKVKSFFRESEENVKNSESVGSEEVSYSVSTSKWYNPFSWGSSERRYRTETFTLVQAGAVRNSLENLIEELEDLLDIDCKRLLITWKNETQKTLVSKLRDGIGDEILDIQLLKRIVKDIAQSIAYPDISYSGKIPSSLQRSGSLRDSEAERFIQEANNFVSEFRTAVRGDVKTYIKNLTEKLLLIKLGEKTFAQYSKEVEKLENEIQNKQVNLARYGDMIEELKNIES